MFFWNFAFASSCSTLGDVCVASISPSLGPTAGGTGFGASYDSNGRVTIIGSGFMPTDNPGFVQDFSYTGAAQSYVIPAAGRYKMEVWGAQGGNGGGKGGYSVGATYFSDGTLLEIYVGGEGFDGVNNVFYAGGFNGGGGSYGNGGSGPSSGRGSGGGGTDIRVGGDTYYHRLIVAGGGGGNTFKPGNNYDAGHGGGAVGGDTLTSGANYIATGGTQIGPGAKSQESDPLATAAGFGFGATMVQPTTISGGGGGWYGGGTGHGGAGGSGWVYTASSFANWQAGNPADAASYQVTSNYYLDSTQMIAGNQSMPSVGGGTELGHSGDGFVRLTNLTSWSVKIGGNDCTDIEVVSETELTCVPPAGEAGAADVEVTVSGETAVIRGGYTYIAPEKDDDEDDEEIETPGPGNPGVPNTGYGSEGGYVRGSLVGAGVVVGVVTGLWARRKWWVKI